MSQRPEIGTTATKTIASNHDRFLAQRSTRGQVVPPGKAGQPRISALKHSARQDRLAIAENEFAFDGSLDATNA